MLLISPEVVRFESHVWDDVASLAIDRAGRHIIEEFSDVGPFATFVDVPEQSITIRVQRRVAADEVDDPALGAAGELVCYTGSAAAAHSRRRITVSCVFTSIRSELTPGKPAVRTFTFLAASDGATDPITIQPATIDP